MASMGSNVHTTFFIEDPPVLGAAGWGENCSAKDAPQDIQPIESSLQLPTWLSRSH
jgi:hypothetical protein